MNRTQAKIQAMIMAQDLLEKDFVVLDTETTDLPKNGGEVLQLGIMSKDGETLMDQLIKPKGKISKGASDVHHITEDKLVDAPTFFQVYDQIDKILKGKLIIAYNVGFDRPILEQSCRNYNLPLFTNPWQCAMLMYAQYNGEMRYGNYAWKKLTQAAEYFNINTEGAHDALEDVRMTLRVVEEMAKVIHG